MAFAQNIVHQPINPNAVTKVHTSIDHISIIALPERIARVAAGSEAMQIEWHDNNVFIKPLKAGQSTNLMVWTEHQFSTYELEAPGDVQNISFLIDQTSTPLPRVPTKNSDATSEPSHEEIQRATDSVIGSTLLGVTPVTGRGVRPAKDFASVQIKEVVRDKDSIYVRFAVTNTGSHPYRITQPTVFTIVPTQNAELIPSMKNLQIPEKATYQFRPLQTTQVTVRASAIPEKDVAPGSTVEGVLTLVPSDVQHSGVYEFLFGDDGAHRIQATAIL
jgi:hypothetical protein